MLVTPFSIVTWARLVHSKNAYSPMLVTLPGIVISASADNANA